MRIAFIFDDSIGRRGGVQTYIVTLASWLEHQGHHVEVLAAGTPPESHSFIAHSVGSTRSFRANGIDIAIALPNGGETFLKRLEHGEFDVLHVQLPYMITLARRAAKLASRRTAIVATYHSVPYSRRDTLGLLLLARLNRKVVPTFDCLFAVSNAALRWMTRCYGVSGQVLPPPLKRPYPARTSDTDQVSIAGAIVFVGRLTPRKGCRELITAYAMLSETNSELPALHVIGSGSSEPELRALSRTLGVSAMVHFLGDVSEVDRIRELACASMAVFPSLGGEGFGYVLVESLALGTPVLAGSVEAYAETLAGAPSVLVDASDPRRLGAAIAAELSRAKQPRDTVHAQRRRDHAARFDIEVIGPQVVREYDGAVQRRRAR